MSEREKPQEILNQGHPISSLWRRFKTAGYVAFTDDYDKHVNPAAYESYVEKTAKRTAQARVLAAIIEDRVPPMTPDGTSSRVLDIAAGTGIISRVLSGIGYAVTATDKSHNALAYLKQKSPDIAVIQADMNQGLPGKDNTYDAATTVWANRYMNDTDAFLREVYRVLKPEGVFIWPIFPTERVVWKVRNGMNQHTTPKTIMRDALQAGFSEAEIVKISSREARQKNLRLRSTPDYVIAKK